MIVFVFAFFEQPLLPTPCTPEDAQLIIHKKYASDSDLKLFSNYIVTCKFMKTCCDSFLPLIKEKAIKVNLCTCYVCSVAYYYHYSNMHSEMHDNQQKFNRLSLHDLSWGMCSIDTGMY